MSSRSRAWLCGLVLAASASMSGRAEAQDSPKREAAPKAEGARNDGVYGRFDGSLALAGGLGAELEGKQPRGSLRLTAHYLWTAGVYARYSDAFSSPDHAAPRVLSGGVDVRPLFLPRFALDLEQGPSALDLALDSISLSAGAFFKQPPSSIGGSFGSQRGFEIGLGGGVPLCGVARGLWLELRGERRFADHGELGNSWLVSAWLSFHAITWSNDPGPP
jgi:hypothetical protein